MARPKLRNLRLGAAQLARGIAMTVQIEALAPTHQKLITADRFVILAITISLFAVQATWTVFLASAALQLIK